jgi:hypothetical protein
LLKQAFRLGQFALLETVGGEDGDAAAGEVGGHGKTPKAEIDSIVATPCTSRAIAVSTA